MFRRTSCIAVIFLLVACGPSAEEVRLRHANEQMTSQLHDLNTRLTDVQGRLQHMTDENAGMQRQLVAAGVSVHSLQQNLDETSRALDELRARERQAQARLATFRALIAQFQSLIASGQLRVRIVRNRMVVELPENILFDSGDAELKDAGKVALNGVINVLKSIANREFQVTGHTDNIPMHSHHIPSNWELSATRAVNVVRYMISQGMEANRLSAAGAADTAPVATNDTPEGRAQNRRIEIVLLPNLDELPDLSSLEGSSGDAATPPPAAGAH